MKLAEVEYTGRVRQQRHRGPSGTVYRFRGSPVAVEELADVEHFESTSNYEVEWTGRGKIAAAIDDDVRDLSEAISDLEYQTKRKLVSTLGLDTESQEETVLEEALEDAADDLKLQMENQ